MWEQIKIVSAAIGVFFGSMGLTLFFTNCQNVDGVQLTSRREMNHIQALSPTTGQPINQRAVPLPKEATLPTN